MRKGRGFALVGALLLAGIISLPWWLSPKQAERLANYFLMPEYSLQLSENWTLNAEGLSLPYAQLKTAQCTLVEFKDLRLQGWFTPRLTIEEGLADYACIQTLPDNSEKNSLKLTALFASLPQSELDIHHIKLRNAEAITPSLFQNLFNAELSAIAHYQNNQFHLSFSAKKNDGVIMDHHSTLQLQNGHFQWLGETNYQPEEKQHYHLDFSLLLNDEILQTQPEGKVLLTWQHPDFSVSQGEAILSWKGENGLIKAQDLSRHSPLLDVPFIFTPKGLEISWGNFYWIFDGYQPIKGFLGLSVRTPQKGWLPFNIDLNVIVQTFGEKGKGEIVISGKEGKIGGGEKRDQIDFDLKTRGDLRYNNTVAQTNLSYRLGGTFSDPILHFQPNSIFKMDNQQADTNIRVRLPLDNVQIGKYGLNGRLQASLQGFTPQFSNIDIKLDGQADEFIAGIKTLFELRDPQQKLHHAELNADNRWDWSIEGNARWNALKTPIRLKGSGFWQADHIELNQLNASSDKIKTNGVTMAPLYIELKDRLRWDYEKQHIRGLIQAKTERIAFDYGGYFINPVLGIGLDGKSIGHFNIAGDLKAGQLGPIDLLARYENQTLKGKISWKTQSAKVFQSLFPQQWDWLIHQGDIKGESDFTINDKGIAMKGNLALHNADISFPDGEIENLTIRFPLHYQNNLLHNKPTMPIKVSVGNMRKGALFLNSGEFELYGSYPNSKKKPLILNNAKIGLFDGELRINKLSFPQTEIATLNFHHINLERIMTMAQYNQIHLEGRVNATLPFWLKHNTCLICNGSLTQVGKMRIKLNDEVVKGLKKGGWTENILVDLLKEMELKDSYANIDLTPNGQMNLRTSIKGLNVNNPTHHPITLNYTHQENIFELWDMIDYGAQFEQNLQYQLYKQLDNEKTP
ncbi:YdbH family protein [Rodentibacter haemolyticus]|uniref:YdbH family protein n=1 Tax=Rodentibacter haemolyticus TaxID=2778911 RepID=A0ABX6UYT5_9PAST|nr:YdbH family protein [Rodentibacter haemolyticus]QPB42450.1 YdbH family protein [Rodentibacter haemolyticus]